MYDYITSKIQTVMQSYTIHVYTYFIIICNMIKTEE